MSTAAAEMMLQCILGGTLSLNDMDIKRRPYHKNCSCALHKSKAARPTACLQHGNISFPRKQQWNDFSLSKVAAKSSSQTSNPIEFSGRNTEEANEALSSR
ncbi:hypothetical protein RJ639_040710 [Escallonia herrerae]|uniref:Uncharacterized protein n=1 Tax=Escallonia herrerae TaxID=1293975 RepID=A0AA88WGI8_9ASTE|nr:hypothetical protein RJ639_040710 [Escallonia herrerae]